VSTPPALRSDARRNRARITDVAAAAFRDEGLDVGVDEIARRAGVGIATLYRHFPAKSDLILAVIESVFDSFEETVAVALATEDAVARLLAEALAQQCRNRGFHDALAKQDLPAGVHERLRLRTLAILEPVVVAGRRGGALGPDIDAADLLVAIKMLGTACDETDAERYLSMVLRGLAPV
jgi:AcrR family transcriptional regulator